VSNEYKWAHLVLRIGAKLLLQEPTIQTLPASIAQFCSSKNSPCILRPRPKSPTLNPLNSLNKQPPVSESQNHFRATIRFPCQTATFTARGKLIFAALTKCPGKQWPAASHSFFYCSASLQIFALNPPSNHRRTI
jgi:hypothetical protein